MSKKPVAFINVYLPYECDDNYNDYMYYLGKVTFIIHESTTTNIAVVGDFNAKIGSVFEIELLVLVDANYMHVLDYEYLGHITGNTYLHVR